jgi:hypothetical protein
MRKAFFRDWGILLVTGIEQRFLMSTMQNSDFGDADLILSSTDGEFQQLGGQIKTEIKLSLYDSNTMHNNIRMQRTTTATNDTNTNRSIAHI